MPILKSAMYPDRSTMSCARPRSLGAADLVEPHQYLAEVLLAHPVIYHVALGEQAREPAARQHPGVDLDLYVVALYLQDPALPRVVPVVRRLAELELDDLPVAEERLELALRPVEDDAALVQRDYTLRHRY